MASEIVRIDRFGLLTSALRNIRCHLDGQSAVFELIPERVLAPDTDDSAADDPIIRRLTHGASLVVEGPLALRLEFNYVLGIAVDYDIDVDLFGGICPNWESAPRLEGSRFIYPLLEIRNSAWKAQLPEWRRADDPDVLHVRMLSAEAGFDVLGELVSGTWIANFAE